jgi:hypothetical protein
MLNTLKFKILQHPPYSLALSPHDYGLFQPMKEELKGQHFANEVVKKPVQDFLKAREKNCVYGYTQGGG